MRHLPLAAVLLLRVAGAIAAPEQGRTGSDPDPDPVEVDVAIIGGGSGGIHAAIQLKDAGASVLVLEKKNQIGGHAETYVNPETGDIDNIGVIVFENTDLVKRYFTRLNVPIVTANLFPSGQTYDFALGLFIPPVNNTEEIQAAAQSYAQNVLSKYGWVDQGYLVPDPVPEELYMPFGDLAIKYNFSALLPVTAQYNWYFGNQTTVPALYGIKDFGPSLLNSAFGEFVFSGTGNTRSLYDAALADLGSSVMLNTDVLEVQRQASSDNSSSGGVILRVSQTADDDTTKKTATTTTTIHAKKLLVAIPPTLGNLSPFLNLTPTEQSLFSRFTSLSYLTGIAHVPQWGNRTLINVGALTPFHQPLIPGANFFRDAAGDATDEFGFGIGFDSTDTNGDGNGEATAMDGELVVRRQLGALARAGAVPWHAALTVTFPMTSMHAPFNVRVGEEDIKEGFYGRLLALQGQGGTYWTGAAWAGQNSALIWNWNEGTVVPGLKRDLGVE